jgi:hypothetical protein
VTGAGAGPAPSHSRPGRQAVVLEGRLPGGPGLRVIPLTTEFEPPLQLLAGIFARKGERQLYGPTHPLNLLWDAFSSHTSRS